MPKLSEFLFGKKEKIKKVDVLTPQQKEMMDIINQGLTSGEGPFGELFGPFNEQKFQQGVARPAIKQFEEEILPKVQERFISGNQALGSAMRRGQLRAGTDLQDKLAQLMYQAQQQQQANRGEGIKQYVGTKSFEPIFRPATTGAFGAFAQGAGEGLGKAIGTGVNAATAGLTSTMG